MAQESSDSRVHYVPDEVVLKIGDEAGNEFDSQRQTDAKNGRQSFYAGGIQERRDVEEEDDDDDDLMTRSNTSFPRKQRMFMSRTKSRLDDRHWRHERVATTEKKGKDNESFLDEDVLGEFDWKEAVLTILQWVSLFVILVTLVFTITVSHLKKGKLWDLHLWKWEMLILVLICGHLVSGWIIRVAVLVFERNFLWKIRVLYFVYGLRKSIQNCLWLGQVLLVWHFILAEEIRRVTRHGAVRYVTKILVCLWVGTLVWLLKTLVVKVLASSFHVTRFFERIQDSLFKQYVIKKLSVSPGEEESEGEEVKRLLPEKKKKNPKLSKQSQQGITIEHLQKLNRKNVSASSMKRLMSLVQNGLLSTLDEELPSSTDEDEAALRIRDKCEAIAAAKKIFQNVAETGSKYIRLEDLKRFMKEDDAWKTMHLLNGTNEIQKINQKSLTAWMVDAYRERRFLALSLDDTKTAVDELHNILNALVTIIIVIIWLFIFEIPISRFLVLLGSQLLVTIFIFGDTCKRIFESIIFLFVTHPFDVGDHCEIDGEPMVVEEMNILTTVFLRHDDQTTIYPNSVLATKPITNYFRSPDIADAVDFSIHISTPTDKIAMMKKRIIRYIDSRSEYWHPTPAVLITDMEDMNRLKMVVVVKHRLNGQHMGEKCARRALLVEEMIKAFRILNIEYRMLPLDMNVRYMPAVASTRLPSNWTTCSG